MNDTILEFSNFKPPSKPFPPLRNVVPKENTDSVLSLCESTKTFELSFVENIAFISTIGDVEADIICAV
jgi:hypothetical protein